MKKKIIVPIVLGSIGLLLGGLIYLGISSFPELLESDKSIQKEVNHAAPFVSDTIVVENDKLVEPEPAIVSNGSVRGYSSDIPSSFDHDDIQYIDTPINLKESVSTSKFSGAPSNCEFSFVVYEPIVAEDFHFEISTDTSLSTEKIEVSEDHLYSSSSLEKAKEVSLQRNVKKAAQAKKQNSHANEALVETSLIVIGVVDIFSMILVHRRKHLFR